MTANNADIDVVDRFCGACRELIMGEIERVVTVHGWSSEELDSLVFEYPLRPAKGLRPSICLATARCLGVNDDAVLTTAAVIELLHNAFLIHDDIEDESLFRRGEQTLQRTHGLPVAVNVGDAMFTLALSALLDNTAWIGLGPALETLQLIVSVLRMTVHGQAIELAWIRDNRWRFSERHYRDAFEDMVVHKTARYSFIAPVEISCIAGGAAPELRGQLVTFASHLGIAFQIADDLLNLRDDADAYGKERRGDLWEGKRTLMLLHALNGERDAALVERAVEALGRRRPPPDDPLAELASLAALADELCHAGHLDNVGRQRLLAAIRNVRYRGEAPMKREEDVSLLHDLIQRNGGVAYATQIAADHAARAQQALDRCRSMLAGGYGLRFLGSLPAYVVERLR